jgi:histidinol-phosphatase (PHP family)
MRSLNLIDYHLHTAGTIDCKMTEAHVCERALQMGIYEIAFTNHIMLNQPDYVISPESFTSHWEQIRVCQLLYPQLKIRLGIEIDYYPGREEDIALTLQSYQNLVGRSFDLVLGSIHEMDGYFFSNQKCAPAFYQDQDLVSLYGKYFSLSAEAVRSQLFDVIAHPDLIKKYTNDLTPPVPFVEYQSAVEPFIDALLGSGVGIEVNTKGLTINVGEMYPSNEFLELYLSKARDCGREPILTLGSDAHSVDGVGRNVAEAAEVLIKMGVNSVASFEKRAHSAFLI